MARSISDSDILKTIKNGTRNSATSHKYGRQIIAKRRISLPFQQHASAALKVNPDRIFPGEPALRQALGIRGLGLDNMA